MKHSTFLAPILWAYASALATPWTEQSILQASSTPGPDKSLVEFGPGDTLWVTDDEKWALKRVCSELWLHDLH